MRLQGLGAPFNVEAVIAGKFREIIRPGAFARSLKDGDEFLLYSHSMANVLARRKNGTLKLWEAADGLRFDGELAETNLSGDVHALVSGGFVGGASIGFGTTEDNWRNDGGQLVLRELLHVELFEISVVSAPAYRSTSVIAVRASTRTSKTRPTPAELLLNAKLANYRKRSRELEFN